MNQIELNKINEKLYPDAKIFWEYNKGYTSHLWKFQQLNGWSISASKGIYKVYDTNGNEVISSIGKVKALTELAKLLR